MPEFVNFGGNTRFRPAEFFEPKTEAELLAALRHNAERRIRAVGSLHSWSRTAVADEVMVSMRRFNSVEIGERDGQPFAVVGAGCQVKRLLAELRKVGLTLPSVGLITEQTIAGATATGTHGSGKHSLSHYLESVRVACFSEGEAGIVDICSGDELRAARCALGCLGVIVSVTLPCVPIYNVEEFARPCDTVDEAVASEMNSPLQQFFLFPHQWKYCVQQRRAVAKPRSWSAPLYRAYWFVGLDFGLHFLIKLFAAWLKSRRLTRCLYNLVLPRFLFPSWRVVDRSDRMLVMEHELFRHLELELFVPRQRIRDAALFVEAVLRQADGSLEELPKQVLDWLEESELRERFDELAGVFSHHYPVCFRRVLKDETLISMASGDVDWWYSISLITYVTPRDDFYHLAEFLAQACLQLFEGRIHWGKWFPLQAADVESMYPQLPRFRSICRRFDPDGRFQNEFTSRVLSPCTADFGASD